MKYLALIIAMFLLFCASAYIATGQVRTTVTVVIPCSMDNYIKSQCMPAEMWDMPVEQCEI